MATSVCLAAAGDKPEGVDQHIGRRLIAAFGNSDGDQQVLEYTQGGTAEERLN